MKTRVFPLLVAVLVIITAGPGWGAEVHPHKPGPRDKCAVCGMFAAKYQEFAGQVHFRDGAVYYFDGSKDLFRFYQNLPRYAPGRKGGDAVALFVTSYYDVSLIDATKAWYVAGSDVLGPMGRELIPFAKEAEAREFARDHHGKKVARFKDIKPALLKGLE